MASKKRDAGEIPAMIPAIDPKSREDQMISYAVALAERQLIEGTASSAVIVHYLKLATDKNRSENEKLKAEVELLRAKTDALESEQHRDELYLNAIRAMREYSGASDADLQ